MRAIGRCAIKIEKGAERCIQVLLDLIQTKVNYVVQEAIIVIKDIFRKYPNRYESIIATLCENLDSLDEPEAKASMIWILGEYAERIDNADELLASFLESFHDENAQVQLQLLTAIVKLFLKRPKNSQDMVQKALNLATQESDNPDLRDRGYVYWRLLSTDPEAAKQVVLGERPLISDSSDILEESILDQLIENISTLASVYHKPPETFVTKLKDIKKPKKEKKQRAEVFEESLIPQDERDASIPSSGQQINIFDLDEISEPAPTGGQPPKSSAVPNVMDELEFFNTPSTPATDISVKEILLTADKGKGLQVSGSFFRKDGQPYLDLTFLNQSAAQMSQFAIQFNKNSFGLVPAQPQVAMLMPQQRADALLLLGTHPNMLNTAPPFSNVLQIAIKNNVDVFYFQVNIPIHVLLSENGQLGKEEYLAMWKGIVEERFRDIPTSVTANPELIQKKMQMNNFFYIARHKSASEDFLYFSAKLFDAIILVELALGSGRCKACTKTKKVEAIPLVDQSLTIILSR